MLYEQLVVSDSHPTTDQIAHVGRMYRHFRLGSVPLDRLDR